MGCLELESSHPGKCLTFFDFKVEDVLSPIESDHFPLLFRILNADEDYFFPGNIYQNTEQFRYEDLAGGAYEVAKLDLAFDNIANIGFASRSIRF